MRILLMADREVGQRTLAWLLKTYADDVAAVAVAEESPISEAAKSAGKPLIVSSDSQAIDDFCGALDPIDLGILAWWPKLVRPPLSMRPSQGFINFHPSLLPYNRGKHYNFWALVEEVPFGASLHFIDDSVDSGDIVAQRAIPRDWTDTGGSLFHKAQDAMFELFRDTYPAIRTGSIERVPQDPAAGSFHRASELDDASKLDLDRDYRCRDLLNLLRARTFPGHPACWFVADGVKYEVRVQIMKAEE